MKRLLDEAKALSAELIRNRRYIHEHAEIGHELPLTTAYVRARLTEMGYEPYECTQCGLIAIAGGRKPGKTFLLRADMDALPILEEGGLEFKSETKYMHACGHDLHTSMLLGAARLLKMHEEELEGQVKLMFQPAEEALGGAEGMVEAGLLENPKVDAAMMMHVAAGMAVPTGTIVIPRGGVATAAYDLFEIKVQGKGTHGAMPHLGVDPLNVLCHIHIGLQEINAREITPGENVALTVGQMHGGSAANVIPDTAAMSGTLRTFSKETRELAKTRLVEIVKSIATAFRATVEVDISKGCPSIENDGDLAKQAMRYTAELLGTGKVVDMDQLTGGKKMAVSDDFAFVTAKVPGLTVTIGAGSPEEGYLFPVHHPKARFSEEALPIGAAVYANMAIEWLKNNI